MNEQSSHDKQGSVTFRVLVSDFLSESGRFAERLTAWSERHAWLREWQISITLFTKLEILIYAVVALIHFRYIGTIGLRIHGFWSWYVLESVLFIAASLYMIRVCWRFLQQTSASS